MWHQQTSPFRHCSTAAAANTRVRACLVASPCSGGRPGRAPARRASPGGSSGMHLRVEGEGMEEDADAERAASGRPCRGPDHGVPLHGLAVAWCVAAGWLRRIEWRVQGQVKRCWAEQCKFCFIADQDALGATFCTWRAVQTKVRLPRATLVEASTSWTSTTAWRPPGSPEAMARP